CFLRQPSTGRETDRSYLTGGWELRQGALVASPPRVDASQLTEEDRYFMRRTRSRFIHFRLGLLLGPWRARMLSGVTDRARPLHSSEGMARQPVELAGVALTGGVLQRIDSSAAKLLWVFRLLGTIEVAHSRR